MNRYTYNTASPLKLTYTGERYYHYVRQVKHLEENVRKEFQDIQQETSGRLRLGVALWRGACLLPDVFPRFHQQYPEIQLELIEARSVELEQALLEDRIDFAILNLPRSLNYGALSCEIICGSGFYWRRRPSIRWFTPFCRIAAAWADTLWPHWSC